MKERTKLKKDHPKFEKIQRIQQLGEQRAKDIADRQKRHSKLAAVYKKRKADKLKAKAKSTAQKSG